MNIPFDSTVTKRVLTRQRVRALKSQATRKEYMQHARLRQSIRFMNCQKAICFLVKYAKSWEFRPNLHSKTLVSNLVECNELVNYLFKFGFLNRDMQLRLFEKASLSGKTKTVRVLVEHWPAIAGHVMCPDALFFIVFAKHPKLIHVIKHEYMSHDMDYSRMAKRVYKYKKLPAAVLNELDQSDWKEAYVKEEAGEKEADDSDSDDESIY